MSNEKVGAIRTETNPVTGTTIYSRKHRGINLPYDSMTKEEREKLNGDIKTYFVEVEK